MKKSTFDIRPELIVNEGSVARINFDVESEIQDFPKMGGEGDEETEQREVFKAYVVRVAKPLSVESIKAALMAEGIGEYEAEAVACEVMLTLVQNGEAGGDELELAKQMVIARICAYDHSDAVNEFTFQAQKMWIPRTDRELFQKRLDNEVKWGNETVTLDFSGQHFELGVAEASGLLDAVERYATACYDVTQAHKRAVAALENIDEVLAYDFTMGYPEKLEF